MENKSAQKSKGEKEKGDFLLTIIIRKAFDIYNIPREKEKCILKNIRETKLKKKEGL